MHSARVLVLTALLGLAACRTTTTKDGVDASHENGIVQSEIDRRIAELRFLHGNELLQSMSRLATMGDEAAPKIRAGARSDDWLTRASLAWVMSASGDRRYIPDLRAMLSDSVTGVRYEAATSLVELGDAAGFPVLVEGLADGDIKNRYKCFEELRRATGRDFGYQHDAAADVRRVAVARWIEWLETFRPSAL
jgi:HEAT repeat protein